MPTQVRMPVVWVSGGAGYIGAAVCDELHSQGYQPLVIDNLSTGRAELVKDYPRVHQDITEFEGLSKHLLSYANEWGHPKAVIHLAARKRVTDQNCQEMFNTNVIGTFNMAKLADKFLCRNFVFASSAAVYGRGGSSLKNTDPRPLSYYGYTKLCAERVLKNTFKFPNLTILRYFNVAGAFINRHGDLIGDPAKENRALFPSLVSHYLGGRMFCFRMAQGFWGKRSPTRDFIYIKDVAEQTVGSALRGNRAGVFNVGRGISEKITKIPERSGIRMKCANIDFLGPEEIVDSVAEVNNGSRHLSGVVEMFRSECEWQKSALYRSLK